MMLPSHGMKDIGPMDKHLRRLTQWYKKLVEQNATKFPLERGQVKATQEKGVYLIIDSQGIVVHVGSTLRAKRGIHQRLYDHLCGRSSFVLKYKPLKGKGSNLRAKYSYKYVAVADAKMRMLLEAYAVLKLEPKHYDLGEDDE
jgi:hypothetical protein